jgi:hypothetical protein
MRKGKLNYVRCCCYDSSEAEAEADCDVACGLDAEKLQHRNVVYICCISCENL